MDGEERAVQDETALRASLHQRGFAYSRIVGQSMHPGLRSGDVVLLKPCDAARPGDIVTFALGSRLVTHRVASADGLTVTCRGDNRLGADPPVAVAEVLARVEGVVGRNTPDGFLYRLRVRAHWLRADWRRRFVRLYDEATLLRHSLAGWESHAQVTWAGSGGVETSVRAGARVVRAAETADPRMLAEEDPDVVLVFPADVYGRLRLETRRDLMLAVRGHRVAVYALPRASAGQITRLMAGVRGCLRALGFNGGEPGDMAVRDGVAVHSVHTFTAAELERELERSGLGPATVETTVTDSGPLVRATAGRG